MMTIHTPKPRRLGSIYFLKLDNMLPWGSESLNEKNYFKFFFDTFMSSSCAEFYEIVHVTGPLRKYCTQMERGILQAPFSYKELILHFADGRCFKYDISSSKLLRIDDEAVTRFWFQLRDPNAYNTSHLLRLSNVLQQQNISQKQNNIAFFKMMYDLLYHKIKQLNYTNDIKEKETHEAKCCNTITTPEDEIWVNNVLEEGWSTYCLH